MANPRNHPHLVNAPVLFRLPNLESPVATEPGRATQQGLDQPGDVTLRLDDQHPDLGQRPSDPAQQRLGATAPAAAPDSAAHPDADFSESLRGNQHAAARKLALLAAAMFLFGLAGWTVGRYMAPVPQAEVSLAGDLAAGPEHAREHDESGARDQPSSSGAAASSSLPVLSASTSNVIKEPAPLDDSPTPDDPAATHATPEPAAADAGSDQPPAAATLWPEGFYVPEDQAEGAEEMETAMRPQTEGDLLPDDLRDGLSFHSLVPPANQPAESPAVESAVAAESEGDDAGLFEDQAESRRGSLAAKPAATGGDFLATATPNPPSLSSDAAGRPAEPETGSGGPVKSRTPNGIADWSKYFVSADGQIRSTSAGSDATSPQGRDRQAIYVEDDDRPSAVDLVPYYR